MEDDGSHCPQILVAKDGLLWGRLCEGLKPMQLHEDLPSVPDQKAYPQLNAQPLLASILG